MTSAYQLEQSIADYFEYSNTNNQAKLLKLFAEHATVVDEEKTYEGLNAIEQWRSNINTAYNISFKIVKALKDKEGFVVNAQCTGDFPESPLIIVHHFILKEQKIEYLKMV